MRTGVAVGPIIPWLVTWGIFATRRDSSMAKVLVVTLEQFRENGNRRRTDLPNILNGQTTILLLFVLDQFLDRWAVLPDRLDTANIWQRGVLHISILDQFNKVGIAAGPMCDRPRKTAFHRRLLCGSLLFSSSLTAGTAAFASGAILTSASHRVQTNALFRIVQGLGEGRDRNLPVGTHQS